MEQPPSSNPEPALSESRGAGRVEGAPKPSAEERRAAIQTGQKTKRRKGFIFGLFAGQVIIIGLDVAAHFLIPLLEKKYRFHSPLPIQSLVFIGMTAGVVMTALLIFFVLGLQGAGYVFGKKKVGFFTAVGRGMTRVWKAAWALGLTLGVIGGTAWFMIPGVWWRPTVDYLDQHRKDAVEKIKQKAGDLLKPSPKDESPANP
jgi:hypothetical protein